MPHQEISGFSSEKQTGLEKNLVKVEPKQEVMRDQDQTVTDQAVLCALPELLRARFRGLLSDREELAKYEGAPDDDVLSNAHAINDFRAIAITNALPEHLRDEYKSVQEWGVQRDSEKSARRKELEAMAWDILLKNSI